MDFGFSQVEVIYIYGECKKTLRSIIQKMERCCPALQHLPD